ALLSVRLGYCLGLYPAFDGAGKTRDRTGARSGMISITLLAESASGAVNALKQIDPWILCFSLITVIATIWMGFWSARKSKTASDFFVAGRAVSVGWNASAI